MNKHLAAFALILLMASCAPTPSSYGVPAQHKPITDTVTKSSAAPAFGEFVNADDRNAEQYFVRDVKASEGSGWRWTLAEPEFRFVLKTGGQPRRFHLEFSLNDRTFKDTGPVTLVFLLNGKQFDRVTFTKFGDHTYDKPVEPSMLLPGAENRMRIRVLNPWQAPDPGVRLGFVLRSAGFLPQ